MTTVMAPDGFFEILSVVMVFHQMFEGVALGTRLAGSGVAAPATPAAAAPDSEPDPDAAAAPPDAAGGLPTWKKVVMAAAFGLVTPAGMAIGLAIQRNFNGNDRSTLLVTGTLDAVSSGILAWVGIVEMLAHDYLSDTGDMATGRTPGFVLGIGPLVLGMVLMSLLGKWA